MKKTLFLLAVLLLAPIASWGQAGNTVMRTGTGAPTGSCPFIMLYSRGDTNELYACRNGSWFLVGPGAAGAASWSGLTNPTGNLSLSHAAFTTTFTWGAATGAGVNMFTLSDTAANTGTGYILSLNTATTSAAKPLRVTSLGTANGVEMDTTGLLLPIGTGGIRASDLTAGAINATTDFAGGLCGTNQILEDQGASWACIATPGGGGGTTITVNGSALAASTGDLDDATPAAPGDGVNVRWQKDALTPTNISANLQFATTSLAGAVSTVVQGFSGTKTFNASAAAIAMEARNPDTPADNSFADSPDFNLIGVYDSNPAVGPVTRSELKWTMLVDMNGTTPTSKFTLKEASTISLALDSLAATVQVGGATASALFGGTAVGYGAQATGNSDSVAVGHGAIASNNDSIAIGLINCTGNTCIAIGRSNNGASGASSIGIGNAVNISKLDAVGIGTNTAVSQDFGVAIGGGATVVGTTTGDSGVAIGPNSSVGNNTFDAVAIGNFASVSATKGTAIGGSSGVSHSGSIALGHGASSSAANELTIGNQPTAADRISTIRIGAAQYAIFDFTALATSAKTFTWQNLTGSVALSTNNLSLFAATTSAQLRGVLSDENGTGVALFDSPTNPTFLDALIDDVLNFNETAGDAACAAGDTWIKFNSTSGVFRKCENGVLSNLDTGGGGGASTGDAFVTVGHPADLTAERNLAGTTGEITVTDGGANGDITVSLPSPLSTAKSVTGGWTFSHASVTPWQADDAGGNGWLYNPTSDLLLRAGTANVAIPGTARGVVLSQGAAAAVTTTGAGVAGQVLISNGPSADATFQDPLITYNQVLLLNAADATVTQTSAATTLSTRMALGTINIVGASITGAPSGCTVSYRLSLAGTDTADIESFAFTPGNNYQNFKTTPTGDDTAADQMKVVYNCTTFPTTGTLTVSFSPARVVAVRDALPTGDNTIGRTKLTDGTDVALVTAAGELSALVTNAGGASAVNIQDGGNSITVDAPAGTPVNVRSGDGTNSQVCNSSGGCEITGDVASAATDAGNPVKVGGVFNTTQPTVTTGQRVDAQFTARGGLIVATGVDALSAAQGTAAAVSGGWPVKVTDGTDTVAVDGDNGAAAGTDRANTNPAIYQTSYRNGTAGTQGRNAALEVGTDGLLWTAQLPAVRPASYTASAIWSPVATSATDVLRMPGNASNTVLVTGIQVSCTATTAGVNEILAIKRSTAGSGGTSAAMTVVPDDSNYAAGSSAPVTYTANPTVGTIVGNVDAQKMGMMATGTAAPNDIYILNLRQKPIVLRGTAENLVINLNSQSIAGISCAAKINWLETTTITP